MRVSNDLSFRRRDHDSRQNSALRGDQFRDAFAAEREHFVQLRLRKGRFLTGALHLHEFAVLGSHETKINGDKLILFIVKIDDGAPVENAGAHRGH